MHGLSTWSRRAETAVSLNSEHTMTELAAEVLSEIKRCDDRAGRPGRRSGAVRRLLRRGFADHRLAAQALESIEIRKVLP
jgi:SOS response regulatory protein OraA/RecX